MERPKLDVVRFEKSNFSDLEKLAADLTVLKALASRTPTPVTVADLEKVAAAGDVCNLFLQLDGEHIVGWCMLTVSLFEDTAHLGPIAVQKEGDHTGHGSPLMQFSIDYIFNTYQNIRRIDLSNRPDHDMEQWYRKFGYLPRTEEEGDPTTVYRLVRPQT